MDDLNEENIIAQKFTENPLRFFDYEKRLNEFCVAYLTWQRANQVLGEYIGPYWGSPFIAVDDAWKRYCLARDAFL